MGKLQGKTAWITGASAGIGEATARALASEGAGLVLMARRLDRLEKLATECEKLGAPRIVCKKLDVRDHDAVKAAIKDLPGDVDILVNNAGLSRGLVPVHEGLISDWEEMIDANIKGLLYVTRYTLPMMLKRKTGHIINLGSISSHEVYPGGAVYCATKFAVHAITKGLRLDLLGQPIRVTMISPGMVDTEFSEVRFHGDTQRAGQTYVGLTPLVAEDIAEAIRYAATAAEHVNVDEVKIYPRDQAGVLAVHREKA